MGEWIWKIKKRPGSMMQGQVFLKGGSCHFSYLIFSRFIVLKFRYLFTKSSPAAGLSQYQPNSAADINRYQQATSVTSCSCYNFLYMSKRTCGQVLVFPNQRLVHPAADDDFVKLLYSLQSCVMRLKENHFFLSL